MIRCTRSPCFYYTVRYCYTIYPYLCATVKGNTIPLLILSTKSNKQTSIRKLTVIIKRSKYCSSISHSRLKRNYYFR